MEEWQALRTLAMIAVWLTVVVGLLMGAVWLKFGGARAVGQEDQITSEAGGRVGTKNGTTTSFSSAQVGIHALLALLTASLATYALSHSADREDGYLAVLGCVAVTGIPGTVMFWKWRTGTRPSVRNLDVAPRERVEDHLPRPLVLLHGLLHSQWSLWWSPCSSSIDQGQQLRCAPQRLITWRSTVMVPSTPWRTTSDRDSAAIWRAFLSADHRVRCREDGYRSPARRTSHPISRGIT
jgi:hypothetical protein